MIFSWFSPFPKTIWFFFLLPGMKSYLNESVEPCDNFYQYACGNYPNQVSVPKVAERYQEWMPEAERILLLWGTLQKILTGQEDFGEPKSDIAGLVEVRWTFKHFFFSRLSLGICLLAEPVDHYCKVKENSLARQKQFSTNH